MGGCCEAEDLGKPTPVKKPEKEQKQVVLPEFK